MHYVLHNYTTWFIFVVSELPWMYTFLRLYILQVEFDGHKITERTVTLTIMSSEDKVFMSINKREVSTDN